MKISEFKEAIAEKVGAVEIKWERLYRVAEGMFAHGFAGGREFKASLVEGGAVSVAVGW